MEPVNAIVQTNPFLKWLRQIVMLFPERDARKQLARRTRTEINLGPDGVTVHRGQLLGTVLNAPIATFDQLVQVQNLLGAKERFVLSVSEPSCFMRDVLLPAGAASEAESILKLDIERLTPFKRGDVVDVCSIVRKGGSLQVIVRHGLLKRSAMRQFMEQLGTKAKNLQAIAFRQPEEPAWQHVLTPAGDAFGAKSESFWSRLALAAAGLFVLAAVGIGVRAHWQMDAKLALLDAEIPTLQAKAKTVREKIDAIKAEQSLVNSLAQQRETALRVTRIWEELTNKIPDSSWVQALSVGQDGGRIDGLADNAEDLIALLERSSLLSDVKFASPLVKNPGELKTQFSISFKLEAPDK